MLREPRKFFSEFSPDQDWKRSGGFLLVSSLIYALAGMYSSAYFDLMLMGGIFFVNAVGMVLITAFLGYMVMVTTIGKKVTFPGFLNIYALASGITLLASWIPFFVYLTEPCKWWFVWTGLTVTCGVTKKAAFAIISLSLASLILPFLFNIAAASCPEVT